MSERNTELAGIPLRPSRAHLDVNAPVLEAARKQVEARATSAGETEMYGQIERTYAAGEPGLLDQARPNYITQEALVRTFTTSFGQVVLEGSSDQLPEFTILEPDDVKVFSVAVTTGGGARRRKLYKVIETQTTGMWKEIQTEPVEMPFVNAFFKRKRAIQDANANDKSAYFLKKELDNISFTAITNALKTTFAASDKVWTFKDTDVKGLPTGNSKTSSEGFWRTLREVVIPYYQGVGKADQLINIHILHTDMQYLFQVAPVGASLGGYSSFQEKIYDGNIRDITVYGQNFRIIPENWKINTGEMYCTVGPVFKMWLPPDGSVAHRIARDDGSSVFSLHRVYEVLSPSPWWTNLLKSTWSTSATNG